ncbi:MAG: DUF5671 domain-containing protein [Patescibacteria group bacterium]
MKTSAKDFFLHIAKVALLYTGVVALLNLLFRIINVAFPQINQYYYGYDQSSMSLQVATLIVVFPIFLVLSNIIQKGYIATPEKKEYALRKWLIYITLFVAGAVLSGDLVTLIYYFLDGREMTTGFILKVVAFFVIAGCVFMYQLDDLKERLAGGRRNIWKIIAVVLVLGSIILGFSVVGSPASQRKARYDDQKITDLQNIQWQVINYWQQKGVVPQTLTELQDPISGFTVPLDIQTNKPYGYEKSGEQSFKLCAEFNLTKTNNLTSGEVSVYSSSYPSKPAGSDVWNHESGYQCFERKIDSDLYPVFKNAVPVPIR